MHTLTELHESDRLLLTAHRGASFYDAENTLPAFRTAIAHKADFIEFDVQMSADGVPVILHDATIDRVSNGTGRPGERTLADLKQYNFSWFCRDERLEKPLYESNPITTFEEILQEFRDQVCMNIQVYTGASEIDTICRLYLDYGMSDRGYMTIESLDVIQHVQKISKDIDICYTPGWLERSKLENLESCARLGCRFVQPVLESCTEETFENCRKLGLRPMVFFSDSAEQIQAMQQIGMNGVLTNKIEDIAPVFKKN